MALSRLLFLIAVCICQQVLMIRCDADLFERLKVPPRFGKRANAEPMKDLYGKMYPSMDSSNNNVNNNLDGNINGGMADLYLPSKRINIEPPLFQPFKFTRQYQNIQCLLPPNSC